MILSRLIRKRLSASALPDAVESSITYLVEMLPLNRNACPIPPMPDIMTVL